MNNIPQIDQDNITTQRLYGDNVDWIRENVPGESFAEKILKISRFYKKHFAVPNFLATGKDVAIFAEAVGKKVVEVMKK